MNKFFGEDAIFWTKFLAYLNEDRQWSHKRISRLFDYLETRPEYAFKMHKWFTQYLVDNPASKYNISPV